MKKNILLISPDWMGLHEDIILGLKDKGLSVDFIPEKQYPYDPFYNLNKRRKKKPINDFLEEIQQYWTDKLNEEQYNKKYDYLFVIDGQAIHPCVFTILESRNKGIHKVNYLFDRIQGVYGFDRNFKYFDKVATFDPKDSSFFNIDLFQIYWKKCERKAVAKYTLFGFGAYSKFRFDVYKRICELLPEYIESSFLKVYYKGTSNLLLHEIRNAFRILLGYERNINCKEIKSGLVSSTPIPTDDFRAIIASSNTIVDTSAPYQDGLTARFMWALGEEKKIITTNQVVKKYAFYSPEQILILPESTETYSRDLILEFVKSDYKMSQETRDIVSVFRIDNWIDNLLFK